MSGVALLANLPNGSLDLGLPSFLGEVNFDLGLSCMISFTLAWKTGLSCSFCWMSALSPPCNMQKLSHKLNHSVTLASTGSAPSSGPMHFVKKKLYHKGCLVIRAHIAGGYADGLFTIPFARCIIFFLFSRMLWLMACLNVVTSGFEWSTGIFHILSSKDT